MTNILRPAAMIKTSLMLSTFLLSVACASTGQSEKVPTDTLTAPAEKEVVMIARSMTASGGVSVDQQGRIYVSDFGAMLTAGGGDKIYRIDEVGARPTVFSSGHNGASGSSITADGHLLQSNVSGGEAFRIDTNGNKEKIATGLVTPVGILENPSGDVYITECNRSTISIIGSDGALTTFVEGQPLSCPNGLAMDPVGNLYTANFTNSNIVKITPDGEMSVFAEVPGGGNGHLTYHDKGFYVVSYRGGKAYRVEMDGSVEWIAGNGEKASLQGSRASASFYQPNGVAVSPDGDYLYINVTDTSAADTPAKLHPNHVFRISLP